MMKGDVTPDLESGQRVFTGYDDDSFTFGDETITSHFYCHGGHMNYEFGKRGNISSLQVADFKWLEQDTPEVLVIGTGRRTQFPSEEVCDYLSSLHIGFESMDSRSASSMFNILLGDGRKVSVAMFLSGFRG
ncbi:MAG: Mth938-like domain-containing protein [Ghiorsea sp.]